MKEQDQQEIERYVGGAMSPEERTEFEARLQAEAPLQQALALEQDARKAVHAYAYPQMRQQVAQVSYATERKQRLRRVFIPVAVAASVILMVGVLWRYLVPEKKNGVALAEEAVAANPFAPTTNAGSSPSVLLDSANAVYLDKKFPEAIALCLRIQPTTPEYIDGQLLLGFAFIGNRQYQEAIEPLDNALAQQIKSKDWARWGRALALTALERNQEAIAELQAISRDSTSRKNLVIAAQELESKLK